MKKIVLLHGALGTRRQFAELTKALSDSYEIVEFDFSGHGGKSFIQDFSIEEFAIELEEFLLFTKSRDAAVLGYSMGGYIALYLASIHPGLIGDIITLGTKFNWSPVEAYKEIQMLDPNKIEEKIPKFAEILKIRNAPNDWKENVTRTAEMMVNLGNHPLLNGASLNKITNNTLILKGQVDNMITEIESKWAWSNLENGSYKTLANSGHPIESVDINLLANEIKGFIN